MNSIWASLLWKEWREHRLIVAVLGLLAVLIPVLCSLWNLANIVPTVTFCLFSIPALSMFMGMNIAAREQSAGTIRFLQALPISGRRPAAAKLLWAATTLAVPVLLILGTAVWWLQMLPVHQAQEALRADQSIYGGGGANAWFVARMSAPLLAGFSILLWMAAAGVNRVDEVRAGAIGFLAIVGYWGLVVLFAYVAGLKDPNSLLRILMAVGAGGLGPAMGLMPIGMSAVEFVSRSWFVVLTAVLGHGALAAWYIGRFGRVVPGRQQALERDAVSAVVTTQIAPPMRSPLSAMVWKQFRESAPLALLAGGAILLGALVCWIVQLYQQRQSAVDLLLVVVVLWSMIGFMVSTVAGVGVFMEDLRPGLNTFWRSRPIDVDQWFAVKWIAGLASTSLTLAIPLLLAYLWTLLAADSKEFAKFVNSTDVGANLVIGSMLQLGFYSVAVTAMVLVRQPIYAVVMTVAVVGLAIAIGGLLLDTMLRTFHLGEPALITWAISLFVIAVLLATGVAWLGVRRDWGWKK